MSDDVLDRAAIRVLIAGDAGSGKTTIARVLSGEIDNVMSPMAARKAMRRLPCEWTVGCSVFVRVHSLDGSRETRRRVGMRSAVEVKDAVLSEGDQGIRTAHIRERDDGGHVGHSCFVEFIDVGGSKQYKGSRSVFYENLHAIILVHDVTNAKSLTNLRKWLREIALEDRKKFRFGGVSARHRLTEYAPFPDAAGEMETMKLRSKLSEAEVEDAKRSLIQRVPVLVIGNKVDLLSDKEKRRLLDTISKESISSILLGGTSTSPADVGSTLFSTYSAAEELATAEMEGYGKYLQEVLSFLDAIASAVNHDVNV